MVYKLPKEAIADNELEASQLSSNLVNSFVPIGGIIMWSGTVAEAEALTNWRICDGQNGTPNLQDKFIVGAGSTYAVDATGGSADAVVIQHNHGITDPGHQHTWTRQDAQNDVGYRPWPASNNDCKATTVNTGSNTTGITINNEGESGTNKNLPPYYALAYIMKT